MTGGGIITTFPGDPAASTRPEGGRNTMGMWRAGMTGIDPRGDPRGDTLAAWDTTGQCSRDPIHSFIHSFIHACTRAGTDAHLGGHGAHHRASHHRRG